jgi:hypothetical protein
MTDVSILHYRTVEARFPYREWVESIADKTTRAAVLARVDRLAFGAFADWRAVAGAYSSSACTSVRASESILAATARRW